MRTRAPRQRLHEPVVAAMPSSPAESQLARPFRTIVFDWHGTHVEDRDADIRMLAGIMAELLSLGIYLVIVTGAAFGDIDGRIWQLIPPSYRRRLLICADHGSGVYGFDRGGAPIRRSRRVAPAREGQAPDASADAVSWLQRGLPARRGTAPNEVLIFGSTSFDVLLPAYAARALVASVSTEPIRVPTEANHLGVGPARLRALLMDQIRRHRAARVGGVRESREDWVTRALRLPNDAAWRLEQHGYEPALEHDVESRLAVSNGFLGVRASVAQPTAASLPRTYVAGLFDTLTEPFPMPVLVPAPDWLRVQMRIDGAAVGITTDAAPAHPRILDLERAVLVSTWHLRDEAGPVGRVRALRFASQADRALAVQVLRLEVERPLWITLDAWLEPPVDGLTLVRDGPEETIWRTAHGDRYLRVAGSTTLRRGDGRLVSDVGGDPARRRWQWVITPEEPAVFTRIVATARAAIEDGNGGTAHRAIKAVRRADISGLLRRHAHAWRHRWAAADIAVEGDAEMQRALRFAVYHLISAANPDDDHVSIGARALTGDAYRGHVFWDTEIFLLPFYTFTWPAAARALLMYRYHTLPAARAKAARLGYRGALYAWESADTGDEATPPWAIGPDGRVIPIRCGTEEHHISADVAYAVWQYWQATGDARFLLEAGAEILLETARFWASRAAPEEDGRFHIRGVIGPDEYHEGVDDNAYTNGMAQWNIERGLEVARLLSRRWPEHWRELRRRLDLTDMELHRWHDVAKRLMAGPLKGSRLIEQFAGYFALDPVDLRAFEPRTAPMDLVLGPERTRQSQVIKQADVVMLLALLWNRFPEEVRLANFRYYEPRCGHGSSLSPAVHALVAARLGDAELAERYVNQAASVDLDDSMGNTAGGVHIGALGGLWQAAVFGFMGFQPTNVGLRFDPRLPDTWSALRVPLRWRGRAIRAEVRQAPLTFTATLERGRPVTVCLGALSRRVRREETWTCRWNRLTHAWEEVMA